LDADDRLNETFPQRIPLKVIGRATELQAKAVSALILEHLGPQSEREPSPAEKHNGPWLSLTFWVTLPHDHAERPLREAIQRLPGVVIQL